MADNLVKLQTNNDEQASRAAKKMPYNAEAEQLILGGILNNNENLNKFADFLLPEHFYLPIHQRIYQTTLNFYDKGIIADPVTLKNVFQDDEAMEHAGGVSYLLKLTSLASGIVNLRDYGAMVYNLYISRSVIEICEETLDDNYRASGEENASKIIEIPEGKLFNLASTGVSENGFASLRNVLTSTVSMVDIASKREGAISGIDTGFTEMNNLLGGFNRSDLIILAARPSMGKTALAINFAYNAAEALEKEHNKKLEEYRIEKQKGSLVEEPKKGSVGVFSLEMSSEQLATRMLSMKTGINASDIRRGKLSTEGAQNDFSNIIKAAGELNAMPIFIDDTPALSISAVRTRARRLKRKHNLEILVVDYLQLLRGVGRKAAESRVQEISEITMGLKAIAKELDIPVIALSQLSRAVEQRADHRPQLSDLRESGSIEQDADIVLFIYREAYYKEREKPSDSDYEKMALWKADMESLEGVTEIMVAKNRNGPIDNVKLLFDASTTKFSDHTGYEKTEMDY